MLALKGSRWSPNSVVDHPGASTKEKSSQDCLTPAKSTPRRRRSSSRDTVSSTPNAQAWQSSKAHVANTPMTHRSASPLHSSSATLLRSAPRTTKSIRKTAVSRSTAAHQDALDVLQVPLRNASRSPTHRSPRAHSPSQHFRGGGFGTPTPPPSYHARNRSVDALTVAKLASETPERKAQGAETPEQFRVSSELMCTPLQGRRTSSITQAIVSTGMQYETPAAPKTSKRVRNRSSTVSMPNMEGIAAAAALAQASEDMASEQAQYRTPSTSKVGRRHGFEDNMEQVTAAATAAHLSSEMAHATDTPSAATPSRRRRSAHSPVFTTAETAAGAGHGRSNTSQSCDLRDVAEKILVSTHAAHFEHPKTEFTCVKQFRKPKPMDLTPLSATKVRSINLGSSPRHGGRPNTRNMVSDELVDMIGLDLLAPSPTSAKARSPSRRLSRKSSTESKITESKVNGIAAPKPPTPTDRRPAGAVRLSTSPRNAAGRAMGSPSVTPKGRRRQRLHAKLSSDAARQESKSSESKESDADSFA